MFYDMNWPIIATPEIAGKMDVFDFFKTLAQLLQSIRRNIKFSFNTTKFTCLVNNLLQVGRNIFHTTQMRGAKIPYPAKKHPILCSIYEFKPVATLR